MSRSSAQVRRSLSHPILDADGHFVEVWPLAHEEIADSIEQDGGRELRDRFLAGQAQRHGLGPRFVVGRHVHRVDHVLDQEQPPPARLLLAGELQLDVGCLGVVGDDAGQGAVGDADDDR